MEFSYTFAQTLYTVRLERQADGSYIAHVNDRTYRVCLGDGWQGALNFAVDGNEYRAHVAYENRERAGSHRHHVALVALTGNVGPRTVRHYEFASAPEQATRGRGSRLAPGGLTAQIPGQVVEVLVSENDRVTKGEPLVILEAMKMESRIVAPLDGKVVSLLVREGDTVERGQRLIELEPLDKPS